MRIKGKNYKTIWFDKNQSEVNIIDQTKLPHNFIIKKLCNFNDFLDAINNMEVRGAPLIGATAAYAIAASLKDDVSDESLQKTYSQLIQTRPTAINLKWAADKMIRTLRETAPQDRYKVSLNLAEDICNDDILCCKKIGEFGEIIIKKYLEKNKLDKINILTHCNAGWLATIDWGTATSAIYQAFINGTDLHVWVDETRPRNQGGFLTSFELNEENIPNTIIADNTGGHLMQKGLVDLCITGADRVMKNGNVINKIGTYLKALAAYDNNIPFYVAIPSSTIDWDSNNNEKIQLEKRSPEELTHTEGIDENGNIQKVRLYDEKSKVLNIAFDITPAHLITGLITERGACDASIDGLKELFPEKFYE